MINALIAKLTNSTSQMKIHPEQFSSNVCSLSSQVLTKDDPCLLIYTKCKDPGAYDQFKQSLKSIQ